MQMERECNVLATENKALARENKALAKAHKQGPVKRSKISPKEIPKHHLASEAESVIVVKVGRTKAGEPDTI
jgi:DNA repair protein RadC